VVKAFVRLALLVCFCLFVCLFLFSHVKVERIDYEQSLFPLRNSRDTSGTFTPFLVRTFESSLAKVHKITKKVGRSAPLGSSYFTGKRLSLLVSIHMAFVEVMLIKQMRLFLGV